MPRHIYDHKRIANQRADGMSWREIGDEMQVFWRDVYNAHYAYNRRLGEKDMGKGKTPRPSGVFKSMGMHGARHKEDRALVMWEESKEREKWTDAQWDLIEDMAYAIEQANIWVWSKKRGSKPTPCPGPTADDLVVSVYGDPDTLKGDVQSSAIRIQTRLLSAALRVAKGRFRFVGMGGVRNKTRAEALEIARKERKEAREALEEVV